MRGYEESKKEVKCALIALGYSPFAVSMVHVHMIDNDRAKVFIVTSKIGIYDFNKRTFVD